jgi:cyclohexanone monooxygenase
MADDASGLSVDPSAVKARYDAEREKRLKAEGLGKYIRPTGEHSHFVDDPFAGPAPERDPIVKDVDVALIGGGFGNILTAIELTKRGVDDFLILDRAADFGGVWYWNRYPGVACDVDAYIYLPHLEEMNYMPTQKYVSGWEIFEYARNIGRRFDLYRRALFRVEIAEVRWDDASARWHVRTGFGDLIRARFVNLATGPFQRPRLPGIPGIETFKGHSFHTSRWDYAYTGGNQFGGLQGLRGKRVGIIGTGATSVQAIPHLGQYADHLYVFQRTPAPVPERNHRKTDEAWFRSQKPGWQRERIDNFNILVNGGTQPVDLVADGWTEILHDIGIKTDQMGDAADAERQELADLRFMEKIRARVDSIVEDKKTAEALKPWYSAGCKRPCFHDDYLATFNRPNVTLVDTDGQGVERVTETAIVVGGKEYDIDLLIYATGFEFNTNNLAERNGFEIHGRGGRSLTEKYREGISTLYGLVTNGFPNMTTLAGPQGVLTPNITHALTAGAGAVAYLVDHTLKAQARTFEANPRAESEWVQHISKVAYRAGFDKSCTPGYYNNDGAAVAGGVTRGAGITQFYPGNSQRFMARLADWVAKDEIPGVDYEA